MQKDFNNILYVSGGSMEFKVILSIFVVFILVKVKRCFLQKQQEDQVTRVELQNGLTIIGTMNRTSDENKIYYAYRGIPFAKPPVGDLRFRAPVPLSHNFSGQTLVAREDSSECVQLDVFPIRGSEDCLYINVYTPQVSNSSSLLSVMVWIYGGGFGFGSSPYATNGPDFLLNEEVIVVTFNYRLGIFGFLSTEDEVSPGNYGLKDQILALQWVQDNIEYFGGNKSRVTLFGESAGAASVGYLSHMPITNGLFRAAIFQSGNSISSWSLIKNPKIKAFSAGAFLHLNISTSQSLVDGLRKVDYKVLAEAAILISTGNVLLSNPLNGLPYGPTIEPLHSGAVVVNRSYELLQNGAFHRIPYMMGFNSEEGISFDELLNYIRAYLLKYDLLPTELTTASLNIADPFTKIFLSYVIKIHYFGIVPIFISEQIIKYIGDDSFTRPITEAALLYSKFSPVYLYQFAYQGPLGSGERKSKGVGHGEELPYLWKMDNYAGKPTSSDLLTRKRLVKLWTNFAKTLNPTPEIDALLDNVTWSLANVDDSFNLRYLNINDTLEMMTNSKWDSFIFWKNLFSQYGHPPYSTY
ncbi:hypothetical protein FQA39_LY00706 [Lamprigera yunnana]|nr:hypothetical protein FQA39_LY00706 [Lamprigera yunnana]